MLNSVSVVRVDEAPTINSYVMKRQFLENVTDISVNVSSSYLAGTRSLSVNDDVCNSVASNVD